MALGFDGGGRKVICVGTLGKFSSIKSMPTCAERFCAAKINQRDCSINVRHPDRYPTIYTLYKNVEIVSNNAVARTARGSSVR